MLREVDRVGRRLDRQDAKAPRNPNTIGVVHPAAGAANVTCSWLCSSWRLLGKRSRWNQLRYGDLLDEALRDVGSVDATDVRRRSEPVAHYAWKHGLHVFGHDVAAAFHERPCPRSVHQGERGTRRQPVRDALKIRL